MASIVERPQKSGGITYQVKWRQEGTWQTENFGGSDPEQASAHATQFRALVEAHGNTWPHGWIRGKGFVEPDEDPNDVPFLEWAHRYVERLTGVDGRTKKDYHRDIDRHLAPRVHTSRDGIQHLYGGLVHTRRDGSTTPATICTLTQDDVNDWVRRQDTSFEDPDRPGVMLWKKASPKSIANRHGLLFCILQAAVDAEPALRATNPCAKTRLPRTDDQTDEEMTFLEREEYVRIAIELRAIDPAAADLAEFLVGTGLRWGEATALYARDVNFTRKSISVQRAWKRTEDNTMEIGPPKTRKARRVVALSDGQLDLLREHLKGRQPEQLIFRGRDGGAWRHANFYNRKWKRAVEEAVKKGLTKRPRIHDLRHTHVSWLIAANIPLPAIQIRLGHESITTTVDRYGHLVQALDGEIRAAVQAALDMPAPEQGLRAVRPA